MNVCVCVSTRHDEAHSRRRCVAAGGRRPLGQVPSRLGPMPGPMLRTPTGLGGPCALAPFVDSRADRRRFESSRVWSVRQQKEAFVIVERGNYCHNMICVMPSSPERPRMAERGSNYPTVSEALLAERSWELPLTIPATAARAQKLPKRCPKDVEQMPLEPRCGPIATKTGRCGPRFGRMWRSPTKIWPTSAYVGRNWRGLRNISPNLTNTWPRSAKLGRAIPNVAQIWPVLTKIGPHRPILVAIGPLLGCQGNCLTCVGAFVWQLRALVAVAGVAGGNFRERAARNVSALVG